MGCISRYVSSEGSALICRGVTAFNLDGGGSVREIADSTEQGFGPAHPSPLPLSPPAGRGGNHEVVRGLSGGFTPGYSLGSPSGSTLAVGYFFGAGLALVHSSSRSGVRYPFQGVLGSALCFPIRIAQLPRTPFPRTIRPACFYGVGSAGERVPDTVFPLGMSVPLSAGSEWRIHGDK
jgi:hypothetical protein